MTNLYEILMETQQLLETEKNIDMRTSMQEIITHQPLFETYVEGLSTGLEGEERDQFVGFANATKKVLMESSVYGFNPYASFVMPILRKFWPAMSIKEAITTSPMDQPVVVKYFLEPFAKTYDDTEIALPDYNNNSSQGPQIPITANVSIPSSTDLLAFVSLDSTVSAISKYFRIIKVADSSGTVDVSIEPDENGNFSQAVTLNGGGTDVIQGHIDREKGVLEISSIQGTALSVNVDTIASVEKNTINTHIEFRPKKLLFEASMRKLSASWSIEYEQDIQNLFNIKAQSEFVDIMSNQIATEIDREIISDLVATVTFSHASAIDTFSKSIPAGYALGTKSWYENILPKMNDLSQTVHNDTNLGRANYVIMNPSEAAVLESTAKYQYISDQYGAGTENTFSVGSLEAGKWKTIVTPIMPRGKMLLIYKSDNEQKAVYYYCPYIPVTLYPFPLGTMPSMTLATRYAKRAVRPKGLALLNVTA